MKTLSRTAPAPSPAAGERRVAKGPIDPRLLRHARSSRGGVALLALIGTGQAAATLAIAVALTRIVAPSSWSLLGSRGGAVALLAGAFALRGLLAWAEQVTARRTAARVTDELRRSLLATVVRRGPAWVASYGAGRLTTVLGTGLDSLRPWFSGYLPALVLGVLLPPAVIAVMFLTDPASAVIALVTLPLVPLLGALIGWATQARAQQRWAADARLAGHFLDVVRGLGTLKMYGRAERQTEVIADLTDRHRRATLRVLRVAFLSSTALDLVGTLSVGLVAVQAGIRVAGGSMPLGPALLAILLAPEVYRPLREMAARYHAATDATAVIADVDAILTVPVAGHTRSASPETLHLSAEWAALVGEALPAGLTAGAHGGLPDPGSTVGTTLEPARSGAIGEAARWGVLAAGLRASYPGSGGDALRLDELAVRGGEIVALRGASGAGKSTALRVFAGLHPADSGAVAVGRAFHLSQRPALPHARTVGEAFAADAGDDEIRSALHMVGLDTEVTAGTRLGEHGNGISAGQRQRLALAALLHRAGRAAALTRRATERPHRDEPGPRRRPLPVVTLLLDEPTAHLDPAAERLVVARLREFAQRGCAVLVVAHRPALLAAADRVVTLQPPVGRIPGTLSPDGVSRHGTAIEGTAAADRAVDQMAWSSAATGRVVRADADTDLSARSEAEADAGQAAPGEVGTDTGPAARGGSEAGGWWRRSWVAVGLGAGAVLGGIVLTGSAAWLLVRAAGLPPVLTLSAAVVLVRGSAVARPLLRYLERLVAHDVAFARLGARRARVYAELVPRVPGPQLRRRGDLLTRLVDDVDARVDGLLRGWLPAVTAGVVVAVTGVAVGAIAPGIVGALGLGVLITGVVAPMVAGWQVDRQDAATGVARAALRDAMVETVDGVEELGTGAGRSGVPEERSRALAGLEARAARMSGSAAAIAHLGWAVAAAGTALALVNAGISAEWSAVVLLAVIALGEPLVTLPDAAIARRRAAGAERRVAVLTTETPITPRPAATAEAAAGAGGAIADGAVRVFGLVAGWDPGDEPTLDGVELELAPGAKVAVTGRSGSGKSTFGAVLGGLLAARAGEVRVGGKVVLVGDETGHVFASDVRENLRLACPGVTDSQLAAVLERVGLGSWLAGLPDGLDTWLGTGGSTMSGGQRRRFATARALLAGPALLILDEPTEGIDEAGARDLMADLLDAASGRTVLVFAHREEGLDLVDEIYELSSGRLNVGVH
ncbi:thiol reductant ABC exporter subunit CydC [Actinoplanes sp. HUAS TT8]|uniref:thiol reductant ABC exporter subunit CydC n=1 Tax=Actinoplanes sp. HUAS TT8 TaxID=3447453 RepID=UPI003F525911